MELKTLYHKSPLGGAIYQWNIWTEGAEIVIESGQINGKAVQHRRLAEAKNVGKANETSPEAQAEAEAFAEWKHKQDRKYVDSIDKVHNRKIAVMLAPNEKFIDVLKPSKSTNKYAVYPADVQPKLDGCLAYDTLVELEDGQKIPIGKVVEEKMQVRIKSFDEKSGEIVFSDITNYMKNNESVRDVVQIFHQDAVGEQPVQWFEIEIADGRILCATGNHQFYLPLSQTWKRLDEMDGNEVLMLDTV